MRRPFRVKHSVPLLAVSLLGAGDLFAQAGTQPPAPVPVTRIEERVGGSDMDSPRAVSLSIAQPIAIREALLLLVTGTPFSIVTTENVEGLFSGELKDLSLRQALEAVLFPRGLDYSVDGTVIRVYPQRPVMRLFDVSYLNVRRDWQRETHSRSSPDGQSAVDASAASAARFFDEVEKGVNALLSTAGHAHLDRHNGIVQVTDVAERLDRIGVYLETVHGRAVRQVRLEARVFEVTLNDTAAHTIDWKAVAQRSGEAWVSSLSTAVGVRIVDFTNVLRAIGEQGAVRMLAAPQVLAMNNQPALMRVGTQDVFFTTAAAVGAGGGVERTTTPETVLEGLTMTLTPQIAPDGLVQVAVAPTVTEKTGEARSRQGERVPVLSISEAETLLRVRDGEAVVLSGFLRERSKIVPGQGIGGFFGTQTTASVRAELVILLKVSIVSPAAPLTAEVK